MVRQIIVGITLLLIASPAPTQQMNAEVFYQRATKLKAKGALAIFAGGEIRALTREGQAAGRAGSARYKAAKAAGQPLPFCPPEGPQKMDDSEYMQRLGAIPQTVRKRIDLTEATVQIMAAKFPCR